MPLKQVPLKAFADLLGYLLLLGQLFLSDLGALKRAGVLLGELLATRGRPKEQLPFLFDHKAIIELE